MRPAHLHFLIYKPGFKTHISQVYTDDDPNLETDSQFGVTKALIGHYVRHETGRRRRATSRGRGIRSTTPSASSPASPNGRAPPISGKARGERPAIERLKRA